jgi:hypothetical protein
MDAAAIICDFIISFLRICRRADDDPPGQVRAPLATFEISSKEKTPIGVCVSNTACTSKLNVFITFYRDPSPVHTVRSLKERQTSADVQSQSLARHEQTSNQTTKRPNKRPNKRPSKRPSKRPNKRPNDQTTKRPNEYFVGILLSIFKLRKV